MAHKMLPPHLSSMRTITFKLLFSKKIFGCAENLLGDDDDRLGSRQGGGGAGWNGWCSFAFGVNHTVVHLSREPLARAQVARPCGQPPHAPTTFHSEIFDWDIFTSDSAAAPPTHPLPLPAPGPLRRRAGSNPGGRSAAPASTAPARHPAQGRLDRVRVGARISIRSGNSDRRSETGLGQGR